jgi:hypothetical protein
MKLYFFAPLLLPMTALADDPLACVDPDIRAVFLGPVEIGYRHTMRYSTTLPARFEDVPVPPDLEFVGSQTVGEQVTAAYASGDDIQGLLASAVEELQSAGWERAGFGRGDDSGFRTMNDDHSALLCRESAPGAVSVSTMKRAGRTYLLVSLHGTTVCDIVKGDWPRHSISLEDYLPVLDVPPGADVHRRGRGGGGDEYSSDAILSTPTKRDALLRHFDDQLRQQGWTRDSAWSGAATAGTLWTKSDRDGKPLFGTFRLAQAGSELFHARFTVISVDPAKYSSGSSSGGELTPLPPAAPVCMRSPEWGVPAAERAVMPSAGSQHSGF